MQPATRFPLFVSLAATWCLLWIAGCETHRTAKPPNIVAFDWDGADYFQERDKNPEPSEEAIEALGLEERYSYIEP